MSRPRSEDRRHDPEEVIEVASELAAEDERLVTHAELREIGTDVGIAPRHVDRAVAEIARRKKVSAERTRMVWFYAPIVAVVGVFAVLGWAEWDAKRDAADEAAPPTAPGGQTAPGAETAPGAQPAPGPRPTSAPPVVHDPMVSLAPYFAEPPPEPSALAGVRVGLDTHRGKPADAAVVLRARGASARDLATTLTPAILAELDALVLVDARASSFHATEVAAVEGFVRAGGALVVADLGWSWTEYVKRPIDELPVNALGRALGFRITAEVAGLPVAIDPAALPGVTGFSRDAWVPCVVLPAVGGAGRPLVRDPQGRPLVLSVDADRGRVVLFGHMALPTQNPTMLVRALQHAVRRGG